MPVAMFCGEIILPITPPDELVAAISTGFKPSCPAATTCSLPNSALPDVSLAGEEHGDPPEERGEHREEDARRGNPETERVIHAGIVHEIGEADNQ